MTLRFQQHFTLFPGVRLNLGKKGLSASIGVAGATLNIGAQGLRTTVGLPGSGLSLSNFHAWEKKTPSLVPGTPPPYPSQVADDIRPIASAAVETLTSASMVEVQALLRQARDQAKEIKRKLKDATAVCDEVERELARRTASIFRIFYKKRIVALQAKLPELEAQIGELQAWEANAKVDIAFDGSDEAKRLFGDVVRAFSLLSNAAKTWDITGERNINQVKERSYASRGLDRIPAKLFMSSSPYIKYENSALVFENKNGEDIYLYPGIAVMERNDGAFALIDLREVDFTYDGIRFVEEDGVPRDSDVIDHTWAKVNRDGTPDRRFRDNYQIPVCLYGQLKVSGVKGIREEYLFSANGATREFAAAFSRYKAALIEPEAPTTTFNQLKISPKATQPAGTTKLDIGFDFSCGACGATSISAPDDWDENGDVACRGCGLRFGTLGEVKQTAHDFGLRAAAEGTLPITQV